MFTSPRRAATVAILKNIGDTFEVLLMKRHGEDRFLPDYYVFPGGALDEQDYEIVFPELNNNHNLKDFKNNSKEYYANIMCGIRETFEESGILFALDETGNYPFINNNESLEKFNNYRKSVFELKLSFNDMLTKERLSPAADNIVYISRWITPPLFHIRYDTRFFAAVMPDNQETSHDGNELVDFDWIEPAEALKRYHNNSIKLVMPTIKTLEFLSRFHKAEDVITHLKNKA